MTSSSAAPSGAATLGFALFDTAIGHCGIAWGERGLTGVQLPEADAGRTRARMQRKFPDCGESVPLPRVQDAMRDIAALFRIEQRNKSAAIPRR